VAASGIPAGRRGLRAPTRNAGFRAGKLRGFRASRGAGKASNLPTGKTAPSFIVFDYVTAFLYCGDLTHSVKAQEVILYAEDEKDDQYLIERAFGQISCPVELRFVEDGSEALQYLRGEGEFADRVRFPFPTVIFLDIKMPRMNGFEVLQWLKNNEAYKLIPVVMVSSSGLQTDIDLAYALGASVYLVKPTNPIQLQKCFKVTGEFFIEHVEKPSGVSP
jgi:CheY-like chemotaxis protein